MMVSQPRRIAASSLMKRLRPTLGDQVGVHDIVSSDACNVFP